MKFSALSVLLSSIIALDVINAAPVVSGVALRLRSNSVGDVGPEIYHLEFTPLVTRNVNQLYPRRGNKDKAKKKGKGGSPAASNPDDSNSGSPSGTDSSGGSGSEGPVGQDSG